MEDFNFTIQKYLRDYLNTFLSMEVYSDAEEILNIDIYSFVQHTIYSYKVQTLINNKINDIFSLHRDVCNNLIKYIDKNTDYIDDKKNRKKIIEFLGKNYLKNNNISDEEITYGDVKEECLNIFIKAEAYKYVINLLNVIHSGNQKEQITNSSIKYFHNQLITLVDEIDCKYDKTFIIVTIDLLKEIINNKNIDGIDINSFTKGIDSFSIKNETHKKVLEYIVTNTISVLNTKIMQNSLSYHCNWTLLESIKITKDTVTEVIKGTNYTNMQNLINNGIEKNQKEIVKLLKYDTVVLNKKNSDIKLKQNEILSMNHIQSDMTVYQDSYYYNFFIGLQKGISVFVLIEMLMKRPNSSKSRAKAPQVIKKIEKVKEKTNPSYIKDLELYMELVKYNDLGKVFIIAMISVSLALSTENTKKLYKFIFLTQDVRTFNKNFEKISLILYPNLKFLI